MPAAKRPVAPRLRRGRQRAVVAVAGGAMALSNRAEAMPWAQTHHEHALRTLVIGYQDRGRNKIGRIDLEDHAVLPAQADTIHSDLGDQHSLEDEFGRGRDSEISTGGGPHVDALTGREVDGSVQGFHRHRDPICCNYCCWPRAFG